MLQLSESSSTSKLTKLTKLSCKTQLSLYNSQPCLGAPLSRILVEELYSLDLEALNGLRLVYCRSLSYS
ncbi:hypothetical protein Ahy_B04g073715 isoform D [Arachis hypogaea]|uniref:Uncharacterized protein n=1 Tax=Arachis hypogaea TaxID=3818 RepID=A0A444ZR52_ARAHY|nr:hypothetical protein Ahy_B04g073715 isoform D [Arachis hypogaea]